MSLQVWLPLNGNLNNQGLSEVTVTNNGATIDSNGKIGSCYSFDTGKYLTVTKPASITKEISYSCWVKISSWNSAMFDCIMTIDTGTAWKDCRATLCRNGGSTNLTWNIANGSSSSRVNSNTSLSLNTWYHIACTYDGTKLRIYVNGVEDNSVDTSLIPNYDSAKLYIGSSNGNIYYLNGFLNDVRIYNHCLSAKEVKEISKGLLCHYKLDNNGFGNPNLINTNNPLQAGGRTVVTDKKLIISAIDTTADTYFTINLAEAIQADVEYTLSCDVEDMNCNTNWNFPLFAQGNPISKTLVISPNASKASITFTVPTGSSYVGTTTIFMDDAGRPSTNPNNITLSNFKLERGSVATQWCPHTSDSLYTSLGLDSTTESDCSGYSYNGTLSESLPYVSNSPRYGGCYYFNSTSKRITLPTINMSGFSNSFSIAWWGKAPSYSSLMYWGFSDGNRLNYYDGLYCNTGDGSSNPYYKPNTTTIISIPSVNTWHHFVMVGDGSSNKLYMDGELYGVAATYKGITGSTIVINGWDSSTSYKTNGYISDFRIYSTALSTEDIKELYNTSASIDKNGNMYAYEFKEE